MEAIRLLQPRQFALEEIPEPSSPDAGMALIRVRRMGICGSDYSGYLGKMPFFSYPRIPGHELGVEVLATGPGVTHVAPGDHCAVEPYLNCGHCHACQRGRGNCCENLQVMGVHTDGGLRPRLIVPAHKLHPGAGLSLEQLALVETLAIGCHAVDRAAAQTDDFVLIVGAGPIGLAVLEFVKIAGLRHAMLDVREDRLRFARESMGAMNTVLAAGEPADEQALRQLTGGPLPTVVFDATGHPAAMRRSLDLVGFTGKLVYVGIVPDAISVPDPLFHRREMTLLATRNALPADFPRIIDWIRGGRINTSPWVSHRVAFTGLIEAFDKLSRPETGVIKAMVDLDGIG
ncbi:MAG: zinc-binding alcohol dehydrogenase family protein [Planctomycetota bacterium]|nr:zinc-binding alcohol dehydrogenase family protein [Planctomycetota bacterium]